MKFCHTFSNSITRHFKNSDMAFYSALFTLLQLHRSERQSLMGGRFARRHSPHLSASLSTQLNRYTSFGSAAAGPRNCGNATCNKTENSFNGYVYKLMKTICLLYYMFLKRPQIMYIACSSIGWQIITQHYSDGPIHVYNHFRLSVHGYMERDRDCERERESMNIHIVLCRFN